MIRCFLFALLLAGSTTCAYAAGSVSLVGPDGFTPVGTATNPLAVGGGADQAGTNATDGQATSTNNQHANTFNYIFNGTGYDRWRGLGGNGFVIPPPAASGKITVTLKQIAANTQTQLAAANANRIYLRVQAQGLDVVNVDETGAMTLNGSVLEGTISLAAGSLPVAFMESATQTAVNGYTKTQQWVRVTEFSK